MLVTLFQPLTHVFVPLSGSEAFYRICVFKERKMFVVAEETQRLITAGKGINRKKLFKNTRIRGPLKAGTV